MKRKWPEKNEAYSPKRIKQPFCSLCEVPCPDENALQNHYQGKKHQALQQKLQEKEANQQNEEITIAACPSPPALLAVLERIVPTQDDIKRATELVQSVFTILERIKQEAPHLAIEQTRAAGSFIQGTMLRGHNRSDLVTTLREEPVLETFEALVIHIKGMLSGVSIEPDTRFSIFYISNGHHEVALHIIWPTAAIDGNEESAPEHTMVMQDGVKEETAEKTKDSSLPDFSSKVLPPCPYAASMLRHVQWFDAIARSPHVKPAMQLLKYFQGRTPAWQCLSPWAIEVLVSKCASSQSSLGGAVRRVFEVISAGCLLPGGVQLFDPCIDDTMVDLFDGLTSKEREDATVASQKALIHVAFQRWDEVFVL